jgi:hypothetical protein
MVEFKEAMLLKRSLRKSKKLLLHLLKSKKKRNLNKRKSSQSFWRSLRIKKSLIPMAEFPGETHQSNSSLVRLIKETRKMTSQKSK